MHKSWQQPPTGLLCQSLRYRHSSLTVMSSSPSWETTFNFSDSPLLKAIQALHGESMVSTFFEILKLSSQPLLRLLRDPRGWMPTVDQADDQPVLPRCPHLVGRDNKLASECGKIGDDTGACSVHQADIPSVDQSSSNSPQECLLCTLLEHNSHYSSNSKAGRLLLCDLCGRATHLR